MRLGKSLQIGEKYGRLTVAEYSHTDAHPRRYFRCVCDCGGEVVTHTNSLRTGNTKSCGCLAKEARSKTLLPNDKGVINHIILQYKRHAKDRGIEFNLSYEMVELLVRGACHYCGVVGGNLKKTKNLKEGFKHNGIDRVDSSMHYEAGNVVSCCGVCNVAKGALSMSDFVAMAHRISKHQDAMADQWDSWLESQ